MKTAGNFLIKKKKTGFGVGEKKRKPLAFLTWKKGTKTFSLP